MTTRKINGATAVAAEQQALAIVNDPIGEISRLREQQLLSGDENAIDALEGEIEILERVAPPRLFCDDLPCTPLYTGGHNYGLIRRTRYDSVVVGKEIESYLL